MKKNIIQTIIITLAILITLAIISEIQSGKNRVIQDTTEDIKEEIKEDIKEEQKEIQEDQEEKKEEIKETKIVEQSNTDYRLTSYYTGDSTGSGEWVGAGIHTSKFEINANGWYTYKGKLVMAGATNECLRATKGACGNWNTRKEGKRYFNYYEEITVIIDGVEYEAIILDSCGASMRLNENRLDLFVSNKASAIDRGYKGENPIQLRS